MDKRFWSGAVVVLTVVVAGASALPGLLLRPAVEDTPEIVPPYVERSTASQPVRPAEPAAVPPVPVLPVAAEVKFAPKSRPVAEAPAAQPPQPAPVEIALPPIPPAAAVAAAPPASAFPPVQQLDAPVQSATGQNPAPTQSREPSASVTRQPVAPRSEKTARHTDRQDRAKRKRQARPAIYPIREFLAWRR
jgi:hypothetical protein